MAVHEMLRTITDKIGSIASVEAVFGEPRVLHNRAIIPVAMVAGGFGAGSGEGRCGDEGQDQRGHGGGGGGGFAAKPLAFLEVSDEGTKLIPVLDMTRLMLACVGLLGGTVLMLSRMHRHRR